MNEFIYLWILWLLWCLTTFFLTKTKIRTIYSLGILILIIFLPENSIVGELPLNSGIIFLIIYSSALLIITPLPLKKYLHILILSYLYVIYFVWYITSPILSGSYFIVIGLILAVILLQFFGKEFHERLLIWITGLSFGQILYTIICWSYGLEYTINYHHSYTLLCGVLILLSLQRVWSLLSRRVELFVKNMEAKKRWTY
ncbi:hypothetical protein SAMN04487944_101358 [Gracilibacillus ureilyticus]|uniref:Uncharacterized protein n=1 Tax=Gracilibacillus ureilyticus TaxID=531814 RepID=A0A1H9LR59_9BACI|nr:hypothetical protein [Gracilibacillus ureilyticus]SER13697.1 hypothetical protein SAMN04487944_101358 [Gracilibacillus ureilyticus]